VKPAPTNRYFGICRWAGAGFLYCWFIADMVGETRPYTLVHLDLSLGGRVFYIVGLSQRWLVKPAPTHWFIWIYPWAGAGFLYCWFIAEMVGETRPYTSIDIILEDDRLYIRFAIPFDRQRTRFINFD